jgi:endonuclease-3 related protein
MEEKSLLNIYKKLYDQFGPQGWWPGETRFEIIVGAILTQNTSWKNVEKAINNLRREGLLDARAIYHANELQLQKMLKPTGYYRIKTKRLKSFVEFLYRTYSGHLDRLLDQPPEKLRRELLSVNGIGRETADSIILYAAEKPQFVVDAYTRRIFQRLGLIREGLSYDEIKNFFEDNLPKDVLLFNEFHALIVRLGKEICRARNPLCALCPLADLCAFYKKASC